MFNIPPKFFFCFVRMRASVYSPLGFFATAFPP